MRNKSKFIATDPTENFVCEKLGNSVICTISEEVWWGNFDSLLPVN